MESTFSRAVLFAEIKGGSQIFQKGPDCQGGGGGEKGKKLGLEKRQKKSLNYPKSQTKFENYRLLDRLD